MPAGPLRCVFTAHGSAFELDEAVGTLKRDESLVYPIAARRSEYGKRWTKKTFDLLCQFIKQRRIETQRDVTDANVSRLRSLLGDIYKKSCISNIRGLAYSWELDTQVIPEESAEGTTGQQHRQERGAEESVSGTGQSNNASAMLRGLRVLEGIARQSCSPAQREAIDIAMSMCLDPMLRNHSGQIQVPGKEAGYFARLLQRIEQVPRPPEQIKAFIRLAVFDPAELRSKSWFHTVYEKMSDAVRQKKLVIQYVFMLRDEFLTDSMNDFLSMYERFADRISVISEDESRLQAEMLRPSIVLLERQRIAFTHDRLDDSTMIDATEHLFPSDFERLQTQYRSIELLSRCIFKRRLSRRSASRQRLPR